MEPVLVSYLNIGMINLILIVNNVISHVWLVVMIKVAYPAMKRMIIDN